MKPILFNTEMVRAILEGRKTVTRRVVKLPSHIQPQDNGLYTLYADGWCYENQRLENILEYLKAPYQVNDILYVRETWQSWSCAECDCECVSDNGSGCCDMSKYLYKASHETPDKGWKPSIHMPKEAARLFLRVTGVRVERLHDITNEQILLEGVDKKRIENTLRQMPEPVDEWERACYALEWVELWDSTVKDKNHEWGGNPYVWVIEFENISEDIKNGRV